MADTAIDTRELARDYLTGAQQPESAAQSVGGEPKPSKSAATAGAAPVDTRALARDYLSSGQPASFTEPPKPQPAASTLGRVAGSVYGATLGPLVQRAQEGGKQIADVILPGTGSARQVPSRYSGSSDALRSRMERPGVIQDVKDLAAGGLKILSSPLAPLGEAARPGGEFIARHAGRTDEQLRADLARAKSEKVRLSKSDPLFRQGTEQQYDALIAKLERQIAQTPEERAKETGQTAAEGAEMLGGLFLPGGGIVPRLGEMVPGLKAPLGTLARSTKGPLALRPEIKSATDEIAARLAGERMTELPKGSPLRPQPSGVSETLGKAEEALTGGARGTQREGTRSTLSAAEEMATGRRLDLGEAGRRMDAQRGTYRPPRISTDPAPELSAQSPVRVLDDAGRVFPEEPAPVFRGAPRESELPRPGIVEGGAESRVPTPREFYDELAPQGRPASPLAQPHIPGEIPDVRPGSGLLDALRDESGVLRLGPAIDTMKGWANTLKKKLPQEEFLRRVRPDSPVITEVERFNTGLADTLKKYMADAPWFKAIRKLTPPQINEYEAQAVRVWEEGGRTPEALARSVAQWPAELRQYVQYRNGRLEVEQAARRYLGLDPIPETPGPYLPRMTDAEARGVTQAGGQLGVGRGLQTTVKGAQHERTFATQLEGEAAGIPYVDRRNAIVTREWNSLKLGHTAQLMRNLEQRGGLFRTSEAARAASPSGQAFAIEGLPGAQRWWTATKEEATFLAQNLKESPSGGYLGFKHYADTLFRNPNLHNPAPHVTKNMGAKYLLSRGPLTSHKLVSDSWEFFRGTNPEMISEFKRVMPFSEGGESAYGTLREIMTKEPGLGKAVDMGIKAIGLLNKGSSKVVFKWADPAMRYSLYKHYRLTEGLSEQAAANHVWIDLVRYGTRSDLVDLWKSIPMNFFVPWRIGTWTTLLKQSINHPVRTAFVVGGVDYLREMRYRQTGRWTHLPWDYVEGPVSLALHGELGKLKTETAATAFFGPGGGATWRNIKQLGDDLFANPSMLPADVTKTLWGISQWSEAKKELDAFVKDKQGSHLVNALMSAVVAERSALNYKPERIQSLNPESLPGMGKSARVEAAEEIQAQRREKADKRAKTMRERPRKTIEDTLDERGY